MQIIHDINYAIVKFNQFLEKGGSQISLSIKLYVLETETHLFLFYLSTSMEYT